MLLPAVLTAALSLSAAAEPKPASKPAAATDPKAADAKAAFAKAQALYKQRKYAEAIEKFEEANTLRPHPVIQYNIAKCWEQLGDTAKALRFYRDYLRASPDAKDRQAVVDSIGNLERRLREKGLAQLIVFAEPASALIEVDGKLVGDSPAAVELTAGSHSLSVRADGYEPQERSLQTQLRSTEITITLSRLGATQSPAVVVGPDTAPRQSFAGEPPPTPPPSVPAVESGPRTFITDQGFKRLFVFGRGNFGVPPQNASLFTTFFTVGAGVQLLPSLSVSAAALITSPVGVMARAAWVPFNVRGRVRPTLGLEVPVVFTAGTPSVGVAVSPGVGFEVLPWLSVTLDVPVTYFLTGPTDAPRLYVFGTAGLAFRFL